MPPKTTNVVFAVADGDEAFSFSRECRSLGSKLWIGDHKDNGHILKALLSLLRQQMEADNIYPFYGSMWKNVFK